MFKKMFRNRQSHGRGSILDEILRRVTLMSDAIQPIRDSLVRMEAQLAVNAKAIDDLRALLAAGSVTPEAVQTVVAQLDADVAALAAKDAG